MTPYCYIDLGSAGSRYESLPDDPNSYPYHNWFRINEFSAIHFWAISEEMLKIPINKTSENYTLNYIPLPVKLTREATCVTGHLTRAE